MFGKKKCQSYDNLSDNDVKSLLDTVLCMDQNAKHFHMKIKFVNNESKNLSVGKLTKMGEKMEKMMKKMNIESIELRFGNREELKKAIIEGE